MTDWIDALRRACEQETQASVAERIGYSASVISLVLKGRYRGNIAAVEQAVRGALMDERLECPILGEVRADVCREHQTRPFSATNPVRVRLYRACRRCPNRIEKGGKNDG